MLMLKSKFFDRHNLMQVILTSMSALNVKAPNDCHESSKPPTHPT